MNDGDLAVLDGNGVRFFDAAGDPILKKKETITWETSAAERGGFDHFMIKEIFEQPKAVADTVMPRIRDGKICLEEVGFTAAFLQKLRKIYLVACGSAFYVATLAKYMIEKYCTVPAEAVIASEFRYCDPLVNASDLVIVISQSGETADTLAALKEAKRRGAVTLAVVNVVGSAIASTADATLYTWAGPEIAVATTKAFSAQLGLIYLLTLYLADGLKTLQGHVYHEALEALRQLPKQQEYILRPELIQQIQYLADKFCGRHNAFYVGRNMDSAICLEGSLKLKEVAYLHSEAYPAGELKHGPISMIEEGTLVIALATVDALFEKTMANIREVKARGADVICVTVESRAEQAEMFADHVVTIPNAHPLVRAGLALLPLQLFAYYVAVNRGCDVDKPRNLAKSVTVE